MLSWFKKHFPSFLFIYKLNGEIFCWFLSDKLNTNVFVLSFSCFWFIFVLVLLISFVLVLVLVFVLVNGFVVTIEENWNSVFVLSSFFCGSALSIFPSFILLFKVCLISVSFLLLVFVLVLNIPDTFGSLPNKLKFLLLLFETNDLELFSIPLFLKNNSSVFLLSKNELNILLFLLLNNPKDELLVPEFLLLFWNNFWVNIELLLFVSIILLSKRLLTKIVSFFTFGLSFFSSFFSFFLSSISSFSSLTILSLIISFFSLIIFSFISPGSIFASSLIFFVSFCSLLFLKPNRTILSTKFRVGFGGEVLFLFLLWTYPKLTLLDVGWFICSFSLLVPNVTQPCSLDLSIESLMFELFTLLFWLKILFLFTPNVKFEFNGT